jgi:Tol biopolymer transport system component
MSPSNEASTTEALIVDGSLINGRVILVEYDDPTHQITSRDLIKDAAFFNLTAKGDFIYRSRTNAWWYGNVRNPESLLSPSLIPEGSTYAALSPNGKQVLWRVETGEVNSLVAGNLATRDRRTLVTVTGFILVPAWSPQANSVAYYAGLPDVRVTGKFTLELVSLNGLETKVTQLAPASYPTGINASRNQAPSWSPDGANILFVGNYESNDLIRAYTYVVQADGKALKRVEGGVWSTDGKRLWIVRRTQLPFGPLTLSSFNLSNATPHDISLPFALSKNIGTGRWKRDGRMFAFTTEAGEVHLIDVTKKKEFKLIDFVEGARIYWLE